jgi:hypothetical protein
MNKARAAGHGDANTMTSLTLHSTAGTVKRSFINNRHSLECTMAVSLLSILQESSLQRHNRGVAGLKDKTLPVTLVTRSETRIDALVKSRDQVYQVSLSDEYRSCTCPDFYYRTTCCKHLVSTAVFCLIHPHQPANAIHLVSADGWVFCGEVSPARIWYRAGDSVSQWADIVCPQCLNLRLGPKPLSRDEHYFTQAQNLGRAA